MPVVGVILAGLCLFAVMRWWSEGEIETSDAVLLAIVLCGLIFGLSVAHEVWQFALAFVPLAGAAGYVGYSMRMGSIRAYYKRRCKEYIRAIQTDPRNLGAREYLADAIYALGDLDRAIDELQAAVDIGGSIEIRYKLGKWAKERYARDTANPICRWCETENVQGARKCAKCGADLPYENALTRWITGGRQAGARYYLILVAGVALVAVSLAILPLNFAFIPLVLCLVALIGWSLIGSARA